MDSTIRCLRIAYWIGALVDVFFGIAMVYPPLLQRALLIPAMTITVETRFALYAGASLMFAWATLLFWADREPLARMGVLPITVCPNIAGLMLASAYALSAGFLTPAGAITAWILGGVLVSLFLFSYVKADRTQLPNSPNLESAHERADIKSGARPEPRRPTSGA